MSCAFEIPKAIMTHVLGTAAEGGSPGMDLAKACNASGITSDPRLGENGGLIGILTRDRVTRGAYTRQAISMALIHTEQPQWM